MSNDGNAAIFIGTFLSSGDAVALCNDCMPAWASAVTSGMLGIDPDLYAVAVAAMEKDAEAADANDPGDTGAPPAMIETPNTGSSAPAPAPADTDDDTELREDDDGFEPPPSDSTSEQVAS
jgi:hypothetical protein